MKPSGPLHLGNLEGALRSWVALQERHEVLCLIADWHAYTVPPVSPAEIREDARQLAIDYVAAGLDPGRATIFRQSDVPEHAGLYLLLSMVTPVSWLERVPSYKDVVATRRIESPTHGLLGYPVLQAADILLYRATLVPVGEDQRAHIELAREIARRFNHLYAPVFPEPEALVVTAPVVPGLDGAKMSKSRRNVIAVRDSPQITAEKISRAFTTPTKIRASDPGVPESCAVCLLRRLYDPGGYVRSWEEDRRGERGCVQNKRELAEIINEALAPIRERRARLEAQVDVVDAVLARGARRARQLARETMRDVRRAMGVGPAST